MVCCRVAEPRAVVVHCVLFVLGIYLGLGTTLSSLIVTFCTASCLEGLKRMARDLSIAVVLTANCKCCRPSHLAR